MNSDSIVGPDGQSSPPGGLRERLGQLLERTWQAHRPWLEWPTSWEGLQESDDHLLLREYLTSPRVHKEKVEEVRRQFITAVRAKSLATEGVAAFLEGGTTDEWMLYSSDCNKAVFRQEAFFQYLVGINEPDIHAAYILASDEIVLFTPKIPEDALRFMGPPKDPSFYRSRYAVTDVIEVKELKEVEEELRRRGIHTLHVLKGVNSDSGRPVGPPKALRSFSSFAINDTALYDILVDCRLRKGGDFNGYATDITFTYPSSGTFTEAQKAIYEAVLDAQLAVIERMRPGVQWTELHRLAERTILKHLKALGLLVGSLEDCVAASIGSVFMPHGLGHFLGMDTHDVGGFTPSSPPSDLPGLRYLRTTRTLEEGMCITVEPGCYFVDNLLKQAASNPSQAHLLDFTVIDKYRSVGGVRLEDDVLVTKDGVRNLTVVPRSVDSVEELLRSGVKPPGQRP
ncbi:prolidase, putative [Eimeria mitis]|uniref:Xaa-Pro dipeptidase n=1 Tax=Eimeria mitis TaxID=44415 RepID=U6KI90_9EIME|nr:prolidase, putative [Eimeria mitis]CDJ35957.1 prolidase, putative [Eimeria mitis]